MLSGIPIRYDKNKTLQTLGMIGLAVIIAATMGLLQQQQQQQQFAYASTDEEECSVIEASDPDMEGWTIETCSDGSQTWITPDGRRCVAGQVASACEGSIPIAPSS